MSMDKIMVNDLVVQVVIGVNKKERVIKQNLIINVTLYTDLAKCGYSDNVTDTVNYSSLTKALMGYAETSQHYTLEALATGLARTCCLAFGAGKVKIRIDKPGVLKLAKSPAVEIVRERAFFLDYLQRPFAAPPNDVADKNTHFAYVGIGSNVGDRVSNITRALSEMKNGGRVVHTSWLYETLPVYVDDQPLFLNAVCLYETKLGPEDLLSFLLSVEQIIGRQRTIKFGPRSIDLDILYYDQKTIINTPTLILPHPLLFEREFVLRPLLDIAPDFIHPTLYLTTRQLYANLTKSTPSPSKPSLVAKNKFKNVLPLRSQLMYWGSKTYIMGILNVTPDSFTDGGKYVKLEDALAKVKELVAQGADIIDIGGQSTKPGLPLVPVEEELARVVPVIRAIREFNQSIPISVDTFYSAVAQESIAAGADMINDVTGGTYDSRMFEVAATTNVPLILMHQKTTPQYEIQVSGEGQIPPKYDLIKDIASTFHSIAETAAKAGVKRWQLIFDPGLGFYKTYDQSREVLRRMEEICALGYPILIGPSRKGFIGNTLNLPDPKDDGRMWGTVACCCTSSQLGVNVVRVHDVNEVHHALRMVDAIQGRTGK